jgi:hypothetical protein
MPPSEIKAQQDIRSQARGQARDAIAARIRRVCGNFSESEFTALVDRMAGVQCKYDQMNGGPTSLHQVLKFLSERMDSGEKAV